MTTALKFQIVIWREGEHLFDDPEKLLNMFIKENSAYKCWAEHIGNKTGKKHYHCYLRYKSARKVSQLVAKWGQGVKVMTAGDHENAFYIHKGSPETFTEDGIRKGLTEQNKVVEFRALIDTGLSVRQIVHQHAEYVETYSRHKHAMAIYEQESLAKRVKLSYQRPEQLREWQQHVIDRINEPIHPRHILWYVDYRGGSGKSTMADYLEFIHGGVPMKPCGKDDDICYTLLRDTYGQAPKLVICDVDNRSVRDLNWRVLEQTKNGRCCTHKYEGGRYVGQRPHLIVFSNEDPFGHPFTNDRIRILSLIHI